MKTSGPLNFFSKKDVHFVNSSPCSLSSQLILIRFFFFFYSHNVHRLQPERSEIFIFSGLSLARFKITANILMAFAGDVFTEEVEDTE